MLRLINIFLFMGCLTSVSFANGVSLDEVIQKISQTSHSKVLGAKVSVLKGKRIYVIKIVTANGRVQHIKVSAETGEVLK